MFLHLSLSHSVLRGEGVPGQVPPWAVPTPQAGTYPPGSYTPAGTSQSVPPWGRYTPRQVHPQGRYTPRAGTPPGQVHHAGAGTPLGQVHPPTVYAGIRSTSGRHASHWNAFL